MARMTVVLLVLAAAAGCRKEAPPAPAGQLATPTPAAVEPAGRADAVRLVIAYGSEKKTWLEEQMAAFHATDPRLAGRPIRVEAQGDGLGRGGAGDPRRRAEAARVQPGLGRLPHAAQRRLEAADRAGQGAGARRRAAGAVAHRDRHVEADGRGAGLAGQAPGLEGHPRRGGRRPRAGARRAPGVGALQARPHPPRVLELGPAGGAGRGLRRRRQDPRPDRRRPGRQEDARPSSPRSREHRPLRQVDRLLRRQDAGARARATCRRRCCTRTW